MSEGSYSVLASRVLSYLKRSEGKGLKPTEQEAKAAETAVLLLSKAYPAITTGPAEAMRILIEIARTNHQAVENMSPGVRDLYNQLKKDDPKQARAFLVQEMMASLKLMGEMLSNISKTRSEISMTFARNARS